MKDYDWLYHTVLERLGDGRQLEACLPIAKTKAELIARDDSFYLSTMSRRVFRAGLKHALVDAKWPDFEQAFFHFKPLRVAMMSDDEMDELMGNRRIIRHWNKLKSVRTNATLLLEIADQYGSVGQWLADWPEHDIVGVWTLLKQRGAQMGGNSAASFLRMVGKDTFLLTEDVVVALQAQGIVDKKPTSQRDLQLAQQAFNRWQQQSDRPLCQISRMLSMTVNY